MILHISLQHQAAKIMERGWHWDALHIEVKMAMFTPTLKIRRIHWAENICWSSRHLTKYTDSEHPEMSSNIGVWGMTTYDNILMYVLNPVMCMLMCKEGIIPLIPLLLASMEAWACHWVCVWSISIFRQTSVSIVFNTIFYWWPGDTCPIITPLYMIKYIVKVTQHHLFSYFWMVVANIAKQMSSFCWCNNFQSQAYNVYRKLALTGFSFLFMPSALLMVN